MTYCTQTDLEEQISQNELIELSDDAGAGVVDDSVVTRAIADADGEIDSYCASRYTVPFLPVPVMVRKLSVDIAIYNLHTRRAVLKVPEVRQKRYENAVRFLRDVSRGLISLGADAPAQANTSDTASIAGNDRIFTRDKMQGL